MVNERLMRLAREAAGLTQIQVAERTGLPQADLSRWERGLRTPSDEHLVALSPVLGVPTSFFHDDVRVTVPIHRTARIPSKRVERQVDARLELARLAASRLLADIDINSPFLFPNADEPVPGEPEDAAAAIRRVWRIPDGPVNDLTAHLEAAGAVVLPVNFGSDNILAAYANPRGDHRWCFINTRATDGARVRFSLAHELGHALLHWDRFAPPEGKDAEREAHLFAASLLMPRETMRSTFARIRVTLDDLVPIRRRWKVSMQALITRACELGLISTYQRTRLWKQLSARGWRRSEPGVIPLEEPTIMREAMQIHREHHRYSDDEIAELCGLPRELLADLMPDYFATGAPRLHVVPR